MIELERLLLRRPSVLNILHRLYLVEPASQTNVMELAALRKYASGASCAVEIGSYQGKSAAVIAAALAPGGRLHCVDPWPAPDGECNAVFEIFDRHVRRTNMVSRIEVIRGYSGNVTARLPASVDFAFIDGDHSWKGIETDWSIVSSRITAGGVMCLHDTVIPAPEPWRQFDSCRFYDEVIARDPSFELLDTIYSMRVLRRRVRL